MTAIDATLAGARVRFTGRAGGVSAPPYDTLNLGPLTADDPASVAENLRRAGDRLPVARLRQVHGARVLEAAATDVEGSLREGDGLVTGRPGLALAAMTADCLPVALAAGEAVGMVHAGWRGVAGGVLEAGLAALAALSGPAPVHALIGPGAGACCYEVGPEVAAQFPGEHVRDGRLDLKAAARDRLLAAGVHTAGDVGRCTMCEPDVFFSHRRSGPVTGRQAGLIWRPSSTD